MSCHTSPSSSIPCWPGYRFLNSVACDNMWQQVGHKILGPQIPKQTWLPPCWLVPCQDKSRVQNFMQALRCRRSAWCETQASVERHCLSGQGGAYNTISPDPICNPCCQGTEAFSERQNQAISGKPASWHSAKTLDINASANDFRCSGLSPCSVWQCWMRLHAHEIPEVQALEGTGAYIYIYNYRVKDQWNFRPGNYIASEKQLYIYIYTILYNMYVYIYIYWNLNINS